LLYDLTRTLSDQGLQIASAKISTYGEEVVDVFYVKDIFGMKVEHEGKLKSIREALLAALEDTAAKPAAAKPGKRVKRAKPEGAKSAAAAE